MASTSTRCRYANQLHSTDDDDGLHANANFIECVRAFHSTRTLNLLINFEPTSRAVIQIFLYGNSVTGSVGYTIQQQSP